MQSPRRKTPTTVVVDPLYTSVVTLALALVTFTPSCFARAMISIRFLEETLWAILLSHVSPDATCSPAFSFVTGYVSRTVDVLSGVGTVVHHQQLNIVDVADEEGLVAGGHHVTGLLVGAKADLQFDEIISS